MCFKFFLTLPYRYGYEYALHINNKHFNRHYFKNLINQQMKTLLPFRIKGAFAVLVLLLVFSSSLLAQPQYYNFNTTTNSNAFPFSVVAGKVIQWIILPGELNQPTPAPSGNITKIHFFLATASITFTNFTIKLGTTTDVTLPTGTFYAGQLDTVYFRPSVLMTSTAGTFMGVELDVPYAYDNTKSLVIEVNQCGASALGMSSYSTAMTGTIRRTFNQTAGGCNYIYQGQGNTVINCGVDISPGGPVIPNYYSSNWCPANTYPSLPEATFYQCSAWLGDTLFAQVPSSTGVAATTILRYTLGGTWTTGVPLPVAKAGGTLTAANGKLYYIGGGATVTTGSTDIYEYSGGVWTLKAPMPLAVSGHATVNWGDSVLFVTGGPWGTGTTTVNFYRIGSNTWGSSTPFATGRRSHAAGLSGNKIFIAGGFPFTKSFQIGTIGSNASTISWVAGPDIPVPASFTGLSRIGGFAIGNAFYTVGGERGGPGGYHDSVHVWSISGNAWFKVISGKPGGGMSNMFAGVSGRVVNDTAKIFLPGGYTGVGSSNFDVIGCGPNIFVGLVPINTEIPNNYRLSQNYPNPFNPITNIKFSIPVTGLVKLTVYDILGREAAQLLNEVKPAGNYLVDFDASHLASGVYFYSLTSGDFNQTKKMLLVK
jgi:hypothetical protein